MVQSRSSVVAIFWTFALKISAEIVFPEALITEQVLLIQWISIFAIYFDFFPL